MSQGFDEIMSLYQASVRKNPALMMENLQVDANRGVTSRGNSPHDKFASPETRAKVLESRMQEIAAFAQSRNLPVAALYAAAEAAMRTGKVPDMGQFGFGGDDAVAAKQFLISSVLNIAGLEWTDYKGDPVVEDELDEGVKGKPQHGLTPNQVRKFTGKERGSSDMATARKRVEVVRDIQRNQDLTRGGKPRIPGPDESTGIDPMQFMAEGSTKAGGYPFADKEKHYRGHSDAELNYAHQDAVKAARAAGGHDPHAEGWYHDDAATIHKELQRRRKAGPQTSSVDVDPSQFMAEAASGTVQGPRSPMMSPNRMSDGGEMLAKPQTYEPHDLLPKKVMQQLRKEVGDGVYGYTREDLFRLARERGLLGTEEDVQIEHDYLGHAKTHGGKFVRYIQGNIGVYDFPSEGAAQKFAEHSSTRTTATPKIEGKRVFIDEPMLGEAAHLGTPAPGGTGDAGNRPGPTKAPWEEDEFEKARRIKEESARSEVEKILGIFKGDPRGESWPKMGQSMAALMGLKESTLEEGVFQDVVEADRELQRRKTMTQEEIEAEEKALKERSESDKILGIMPGDPRNDTWPKMSPEMARLMNLESVGVFRGPRGLNQDALDHADAKPIQEMTVSGGMGAFIGAGMGSGLTGRTVAKPSYDASYELPEDPEKRIEMLTKMLSKHGLKPVQEDEVYEPAPNSTEVPVVRDPRYDAYASHFVEGEGDKKDAWAEKEANWDEQDRRIADYYRGLGQKSPKPAPRPKKPSPKPAKVVRPKRRAVEPKQFMKRKDLGTVHLPKPKAPKVNRPPSDYGANWETPDYNPFFN